MACGRRSSAIENCSAKSYLKAMTDPEKTELEAAAFRRLVQHLRGRTDVQNIDLMNLAGFCRNCLSNWMVDAANSQGVALSKDDARAHVYGMPYDDWKALHQKDAPVAPNTKHSH
jgi:uncharacterized protein